MSYIIVGLGNPGEEYRNTRHNTGRIILETFRKQNNFSEWETDKKLKALVSEGVVEKGKEMLVEPETFMNKSGESVKPLITSAKKAEKLVVIHDDLDIPIGKFKVSFGKNSGGHRGVESIIKAVKTKDFIRIRVGISPATPSGKIKKPSGEKDVEKHILGEFKKSEFESLKKVGKSVAEVLEILVKDGRELAMSASGRVQE
ncbi:MAG: aminoacyl-tRNA hydrolase [Candidatus Paceibacterota bacterium]